jgi:hypothetical protein
MNTQVIVTVVLGSLLGGVLLVFVAMCIIRRCRSSNRSSSNFVYDKVNHGLDEEEIEFKNMIESGGLDFDNLDDDIFEDSKEDLTFNPKEKNRLNMLENLRSNLVSSASAQHPASDDEASDNERIRL